MMMVTRRVVEAGVVVCCVGIGATAARAQVEFSVIAQTGQQVPGQSPGVVFAQSYPPPMGATTAFTDCTLDARGDVTLFSYFHVPVGNGGAGIHRMSGGSLAPVWFADQPDPARPGATARMYDIRLFNEGASAGIVAEGPTASPQYGYGIGDPFSIPVMNGEPTGTPGESWYFQNLDPGGAAPGFSANRSGQGVFASLVVGGYAAGYFDSIVGAHPILRRGNAPPNPPASSAGQQIPTIQQPLRPAIGEDGTIAVASTMSETVHPWLFVGTSTNLRPVLNSFDDTPGMPAGARVYISSYPIPAFFNSGWPSAAIAPDGRIATIVQFSGPGTPLQGAVLAGSASGVQAVVHDKESVQGLAPGIVVRLGAPQAVLAARGGLIAFQTYIASASASQLTDQAVVAGIAGSFRTIVQKNDPFGLPDTTVFNCQLVGINAFQDVLVDATLAGSAVNSQNGRALVAFTQDLGKIVVLRTGDALQLGPGDQRVVTVYTVSGGLNSLRNSQINDSRQVVAAVGFADGSEAVLKFTLPRGPCPADFDHVNGLNAQDIFEFLGAWFAGEARADFNGVNGLDVQDVFDYLGAWFAGCP